MEDLGRPSPSGAGKAVCVGPKPAGGARTFFAGVHGKMCRKTWENHGVPWEKYGRYGEMKKTRNSIGTKWRFLAGG